MNDNYSKKRPSVPNPDVGNLVRCTGPILSDKNYIKRLNFSRLRAQYSILLNKLLLEEVRLWGYLIFNRKLCLTSVIGTEVVKSIFCCYLNMTRKWEFR